MMFVGGLMVALAVEKCNLHKRIAVGILHVMGTKPLWYVSHRMSNLYIFIY